MLNDALSTVFPILLAVAGGALVWAWKKRTKDVVHLVAGVCLVVAGLGQLGNNRNFGRGRYFDVPSFGPSSHELDALFVTAGFIGCLLLAYRAVRAPQR